MKSYQKLNFYLQQNATKALKKSFLKLKLFIYNSWGETRTLDLTGMSRTL